MMADEEDDNDVDADYVFYRDRPEWKDIEPISLDEGPHQVVRIAYSEKFKDIFDYFRAILAKKEISERAFELTEDACIANAANYTIWHYRRILLKELNKDLYKELKFVQAMIEDNGKNYQVWYHRQVIVEWLQDPSHEKLFTQIILAIDPKNYHAWQHRQWVLKTFNLFDGELDYVSELLDNDIRNNSAWNQRFFVLSSTGKIQETLSSEIKFTLSAIEKAPTNESAWNYLRGILQEQGLTKCPTVTEFIQNCYDSGCRSPYLLAFMIDSYEETLLAGGEDVLCQKAIELCNDLAKKYDPIRSEYWNYIARGLGNVYGPEEAHVKRSFSYEFKNAS